MWSTERARGLARGFVRGMVPRWSHLSAVGSTAESLAVLSPAVSADVVSAAWVHDIGYAPELAEAGFHALDGARALERLGAPAEVVGLVAHHTGARYEAEERGLSDQWSQLPRPEPMGLDILTMIDLATAPDGRPVLDRVRVAEILQRYSEGHPVYRAVSRSQGELLAASRRGKRALGLADDWPVESVEGVLES